MIANIGKDAFMHLFFSEKMLSPSLYKREGNKLFILVEGDYVEV